MMLNTKEQAAFRKHRSENIQKLAKQAEKIEDGKTLFQICQAIQSEAIKIFESSKGSIPNEWEWREDRMNREHVSSDPLL